MAFADDLLDQAMKLARLEPKRPKQASLRRAVSTAYYAVFHLLISEAARNWKRQAQRDLFARAFDHGQMKRACERKTKEIDALAKSRTNTEADRLLSTHLRRVTTGFVELQHYRHRADYDNGTVWFRTGAIEQIDAARDVFTSWKAIRNEDAAQDFLVTFLLKDR